MIVLNVGGGSRNLPARFDGWDQHLLDIDSRCSPDICCDAKDIDVVETYDAVHCSHNLEHFYKHDVPVVLAGFYAALKRGGFVDISVPNIKNLMQMMLQNNLDIDDVWYRAGNNPITFHDVLYGWNHNMELGNLYYAHKCGFTPYSLGMALEKAGFVRIGVADQGANIYAIAYKE